MAVVNPLKYLYAYAFTIQFFWEPPEEIAALEALVRSGGGRRSVFPGSSVESLEGEKLLLTEGWTSNRSGDRIASMAEELSALTRPSAGEGVALVDMLDRGQKVDRSFLVFFAKWRWLPFQLDASSESVSRERVVLYDVRYHEVDYPS